MKIVCDNCATKYSIADEKVSGKVFKIRCKKCSHIIVVKGTGEGEALQPAPAESAPSAGQEAPPAEQGPPSDAVWHLVIDREQVGPMTAEDVRAKFQAGQIDADTYVWREGFDDWLKLASIDDFRDLAQAKSLSDQETHRSGAADLYRQQSRDEEPAPGADLFGAPGAHASEGMRTAAPNAATMMASSGSAPSASASSWSSRQSSSSDEMTASPAVSGGGVDVKPMTGTRSENSVLFSLNNLQALATGSAGPQQPSAIPTARPGYANSQTEGSGLIDIRAMAAQTLSASSYNVGNTSKPDELPMANDAPMFSPIAPSMLLPNAEQSGMPKWVYGVIAGGVVAVLGMVGVLIWAIKSPPPGPAVVAPPAVTSGPGTTGTSPTVVAKTDHPGGTAPGDEPGATPQKPAVKESGTTAAGAEPGERKPGRTPRVRDKGPKATAGGKEPTTAPSPVQPQRVEQAPEQVKKPKPARARDNLDSLLDSASAGSGGKPKAETAKKDAPEQLSMDMIKSGLKGVNGAVQSCKDQFKTPGTYVVKLTIAKSGRVSDASVPGKSGDPTADCVSKAVKGARFSEFTGDPQTLSYPFILR